MLMKMNVGTSLLIQMCYSNALTHESVITLCFCSDDIKEFTWVVLSCSHTDDGQKQSRNTIVPSINATFVKPVMLSVFFRGFDSTLFEALHCGQEVTVVRDA